jgi:hypothetical protein
MLLSLGAAFRRNCFSKIQKNWFAVPSAGGIISVVSGVKRFNPETRDY